MKRLILFLMVTSIIYGKMNVATTIFPVYDAVKVVGGDKVDTTLLIKPGIEPHSFEPSPRDISEINRSEILMYLDDSMETWIHKFESNIETLVFRVSEGVAFMEEEEEEDDHGHHHHHHSRDPHIWLDPVRYMEVVENIYEKLVEIDGENKDYYNANYEEYIEKLEDLHEGYEDMARNVRYKKIIYAGHFSFGYMVDRYDLEYETVYKNFSPNSGISPRDLQKIIVVVRESGQGYIYQEALVNSKTADLISEETGADILLLHQLGGVSKDEYKDGMGYLEIMMDNLNNLKKGLGYE